jgi:hypothetical protein
MLYRILAGLVAAVMAITAVTWVFDPAAAAMSLGMPYLEGMGRSSQIGDVGALFMFMVIMCVMGAITRVGHYLQSAGLVLLLIAIFRTLAWAVYDAELAGLFIAVELVCAAVLFFSASRIGRRADLI